MSAARIPRPSGSGQFVCAICNEPVKLETSKTDADGQAVHDHCYLDKICGKIPPSAKRKSVA